MGGGEGSVAPECRYARRTLLKSAVSVGLGLSWIGGVGGPSAVAAQEMDLRRARPREGDRFVFTSGGRIGKVIDPDDVPIGGPSVLAYPVDPRAGIVRDGSRLNQILLIHLGAEELVRETRARAAEGIVAYSAVCTHAGCDVSVWRAELKTLRCPCHESDFDPRDGARVLGGPAPRRLPSLPVKVVDGVLMAAGGFSSRVGFQGGG